MRRVLLLFMLAQTTMLLLPEMTFSADPSYVSDALKRCVRAADGIADYTAVIHQKQRIGDVLKHEEVIIYKYKRPNSVYIKWIGEVNNGMEVVFREGYNDNKLSARLSGALGALVLSLEPGSHRSLNYTRHPIDESSLIYMLETVDKSIRYAQSHPEDAVTVIDSGTVSVLGTVLRKIVITTPWGEGKPYYAPRSVFGIDEGLYLPRYFASYGRKGELWEEYRFDELRVNVGLPDSAFELKGNQDDL